MSSTLLLILIAITILSSVCLSGMYILSFKRRWFDVPIERSSHTRIVPRTAGIVIAILSIVSLFIFGPANFQHGVIYFSLIIFLIIGIYDDIKDVKASTKFWAQLIIAISISIVLPNFRINNFYGVLGVHEIPDSLAICFTSFVFVVVINAYNLIDGVDGLAVSFSIFAILLLGYAFVDINNELFQFCLIIVAILLPFYFFNFSKNRKMFLGDTGSLFLGTTIVLLTGFTLNSENKVQPLGDMNRAMYALVALCYPLLDTLRVFTLRITRGQSPFKADKSHLHHKLIGIGFNHATTTMSLVAFNVLILLVNYNFLQSIDVNAVLIADFIMIGFFFIGGLWYTRHQSPKTSFHK